MSDPQTLHLITHAKTLVMRQVGWDESAPISNEQAIELSSRMGIKTGKSINSGELLKFWNAAPAAALSNVEMLEALAQFQEYANWEEFLSTHQMRLGNAQNSLSVNLGAGPIPVSEGEEALHILQKKNNQLRILAWVLGALNMLLLGFLLYRIFGMDQ